MPLKEPNFTNAHGNSTPLVRNMLKRLWKMGEIAPEEQFLPLSTIFYYLMLDFYVKTGIRFSLRDKRLFEITEVEITRVNCYLSYIPFLMLVADIFIQTIPLGWRQLL